MGDSRCLSNRVVFSSTMASLIDSQNLALLVLLLPTCLVFIIASFLLFRKTSTAYRPGPRSLPIIGSLHHLFGGLPHRSLQHLSKIHGPFMYMQLGTKLAVIVSTPAIAREILKTHDAIFCSRTRMTSGAVMFDSRDMGMAPYGPYWRLVRLICNRDFFNNKMVEGFAPIRAQEVTSLVRMILKDSKMGREIPVVSRLLAANNNIISKMTFGKTFSELIADSSHDDKSEHIVAVITEVMELLTVVHVGDFVPCLQWMDIHGYIRRMKVAAKQSQSAFQKIIESRREMLQKEPTRLPSDLLDVLLKCSKESNRENVLITDEHIKAILLDIFTAGTDTSAYAVEWALAELLRNPSVMKKLQEELDSVVGKRSLVQESDLEQLLYLQSVVKETMRLHPVVPIINHDSIAPCEVAGYDVPANTMALINVWAIGRDEDVWENALKFWPERFVGNSVDLQGQHSELIPFGSGRRGCPGWKLGLRNVHLMLANLVHGFDWSLPSSKTEIDMTEKYCAATRMASPLLAIATPRLGEYL